MDDALIFVAYEGFQLLTYDYGNIENHKRNLPRVIFISISLVAVLYMVIAFATTGALSDEAISGRREIVLAYVAQPVLDHIGVIIVLVAAVFSTASAINATLFATARLAVRISQDQQLPHSLTRRHVGSVPVWFVILACGCTIVLLAYNLYDQDPVTLWVVAGIAAILIGLRVLYTFWHPGFLKKYGRAK